MSKSKILTILIIAAGAAFLIFFGARAMHAFNKMRGHGPFNHRPPIAEETDVELIRDWMTIPYIAHTYAVPDQYLFEQVGIPFDKQNRKKSLQELNASFFPNDDGIVLEKVKAAVKEFQENPPPPPPDKPGAPEPENAPTAP